MFTQIIRNKLVTTIDISRITDTNAAYLNLTEKERRKKEVVFLFIHV